MSVDIELRELPSPKTSSDSSKSQDSGLGNTLNSTTEGDDSNQSETLWAYGSAILLFAFATLLIFFPQLLLVASQGAFIGRSSLTPLESFLSLHGGILLLAISMALLFNVQSRYTIPIRTSTIRHPLLVPLTSAYTATALLSYRASSGSSLEFLVFVGTATLSVWGIWAVLFANSSSYSRKTGADKHTSRFIFGNKSAASSQKERWKAEQRRQ